MRELRPHIQFLLADHKEESVTVYTDGFRAYDTLDEDDVFDRKYVVYSAVSTLTEMYT